MVNCWSIKTISDSSESSSLRIFVNLVIIQINHVWATCTSSFGINECYIDSAFNYHKSLMYQAFPSGIHVSFEQDLKFLRCAFFILLLWSIFRTYKSNIFHSTKSDISVTFTILHFHQTQKKQSFLKNGQKISTTTITDG